MWPAGHVLDHADVSNQATYMLLQEVQQMKNIDELEAFMLKHGENIVDMMGAEIDRIEMKLRVSILALLGTQTFISKITDGSITSYLGFRQFYSHYSKVSYIGVI
jgi:uncharacterized Fe-S cluster-containing MiaB family protein